MSLENPRLLTRQIFSGPTLNVLASGRSQDSEFWVELGLQAFANFCSSRLNHLQIKSHVTQTWANILLK